MSQDNNLLHLISHPGLGGAQTIVRGIVIKNKNHYVYSLRKDIYNSFPKDKRIFYFSSYNYHNFNYKIFLDLYYLMKKYNFKVLHVHLGKPLVYALLLKIFFPNIKIIHHEHGNIFNERKYQYLLKVLRNRIDLFIAVSKATKQKLIEKANIDYKKIIVLYNFVDLDKFNIKNIKWNIKKEREKLGIKKGEFVIGFAGRLIERKGWRDFIEAANILVMENKKYKFLIAGDGPDRQYVINLIKKYNLGENVVYLGYQSNMVWFYSILDIFVMPSHWEPMGLTELEAQAMGIPLVASDVDGLNEVVHNKRDCLLFKSILSNAIKMINKNKHFKDKLSKKGLVNANVYSLNKYIENLNKIYNGL